MVCGAAFVGTCVLISFVEHVHDVAVVVGMTAPMILCGLFIWWIAGIWDPENSAIRDKEIEAIHVARLAREAAEEPSGRRTTSEWKTRVLGD